MYKKHNKNNNKSTPKSTTNKKFINTNYYRSQICIHKFTIVHEMSVRKQFTTPMNCNFQILSTHTYTHIHDYRTTNRPIIMLLMISFKLSKLHSSSVKMILIWTITIIIMNTRRDKQPGHKSCVHRNITCVNIF